MSISCLKVAKRKDFEAERLRVENELLSHKRAWQETMRHSLESTVPLKCDAPYREVHRYKTISY